MAAPKEKCFGSSGMWLKKRRPITCQQELTLLSSRLDVVYHAVLQDMRFVELKMLWRLAFARDE